MQTQIELDFLIFLKAEHNKNHYNKIDLNFSAVNTSYLNVPDDIQTIHNRFKSGYTQQQTPDSGNDLSFEIFHVKTSPRQLYQKGQLSQFNIIRVFRKTSDHNST